MLALTRTDGSLTTSGDPAVDRAMIQIVDLNPVQTASLRRLLVDIMRGHTRVRMPSDPHDSAALFPALVERMVGKRARKLGTWESWAVRHSHALAPVFSVVWQPQPRPQPQPQPQPDQRPQGKSKRKSNTANSAAQGDGAHPQRTVVRSRGRPDTPETIQESLDQLHMDMRAEVLAKHAQVGSPPSSPTRRNQLVSTGPSLEFQSQAYQYSLAAGTGFVTRVFDSEGAASSLPTESYTPEFDRNDLYLTNQTGAQRLFSLAEEVTTHAQQRKAQGLTEFEEVEDFPHLQTVCITHTSRGGKRMQYVTWCLPADLPSLIPDILTGTVRCNALFSGHMEQCASIEPGHWKRRYTIVVIDDLGGTVTERSLTNFLSSLTCYIDLHKCRQPHGFNTVDTPHARHRLIYEMGSVRAYRLMWMAQRAQDQYDTSMVAAENGLAQCADTIATFYTHAYRLINDHAVSDSAAGKQVFTFVKLARAMYHETSDHVDSARNTSAHLRKCRQERAAEVETRYAEAQVRSCRQGIAVPERINTMYDAVNREGEVFDGYWGVQERFNQLTEMVEGAEAWYVPRRPTEAMQRLRAMILLEMWQPQPMSEELWKHTFADVPWPDGPPVLSNSRGEANVVNAACVREAYKNVVKVSHPDHNNSTIASTARTQAINGARTLLLQAMTAQEE